MLVLIAIDPTSAHRRRAVLPDAPAAVDGELVVAPVIDCADIGCDTCASGWFGLVSHGATTTAMVVDRPGVTRDDLGVRIRDLLECLGVVDDLVSAVCAGRFEVDGRRVDDPVVAVDELVRAHLDDIRAICSEFSIGTELSRLGPLVSPIARRLAA